jgi:hypothetical protein
MDAVCISVAKQWISGVAVTLLTVSRDVLGSRHGRDIIFLTEACYSFSQSPYANARLEPQLGHVASFQIIIHLSST